MEEEDGNEFSRNTGTLNEESINPLIELMSRSEVRNAALSFYHEVHEGNTRGVQFREGMKEEGPVSQHPHRNFLKVVVFDGYLFGKVVTNTFTGRPCYCVCAPT